MVGKSGDAGETVWCSVTVHNCLGHSGILPLIEESYEAILLSLQEDYGIDRAIAEKLYRHLWIYTHGIATLCATKMCRFTGEEISSMITEVFTSILKNESV